MKNSKYLIAISLFLISTCLNAQKVPLKMDNLIANKVFLSYEKQEGEKALKVLVDTTIKAFDEPTFAKIKDLDFENGVIIPFSISPIRITNLNVCRRNRQKNTNPMPIWA